jgi:hypothetical protein
MTASKLPIEHDCEAITPDSLRRPVKVIRKRFSDLANAQRTRHGQRFRSLINNFPDNEMPAFATQFELMVGILSATVGEAFSRFLKMAQANEQALKLSPIDWANRQVENLVAAETDALPDWVVHVCDPAVNRDSWRAPKWLSWVFNRPNQNDYDPRNAWLRGDETTTGLVLNRITDRFQRELQSKLKNAGDEASVRLACAPHEDKRKGGSSKGGSQGVKRKRSNLETRRDGIAFGALQGGLKGIKYCKHLDDWKMLPTEEWRTEGCPATYAAAYRDQTWRKKIQDQKHRFQVRYDSLSASQRDKLIQRVTRATR